MSITRDVSGNEVIITPETEESKTEIKETSTPTQDINVSVDNTEMCEILTQLLTEVQRTNEENNKIYEAMLLHHEEYLQNHKNSMELLEKMLLEEETEEAETETVTHEEIVEEQLLLIGENLVSINDTVSGNATLLNDINVTVSGNATEFGGFTETYTEQTEATKEADNYNLAIGVGTIFLLAVIVGLIIAKTAWGRMK